MTDESNPRRWSIPSWRRITEFFLTIGQLERSYQTLKADNEKLNNRLAKLEQEVGEHGGQLKVLMGFVQAALDKQLEIKAEQAAARHVERLIARRSKPPADNR